MKLKKSNFLINKGFSLYVGAKALCCKYRNKGKISYWQHWWKLEHWQDPSGTIVKINLLRNVIVQKEVATQFPLDDRIIVSGEQNRKVRTTLATNITKWRDFYDVKNEVKFVSFR
ncbi:hypothetical protein [Nostoc sp. ChiQUE01b]|uniref:hypothetical protein n=1 Tax=Nostoc sp. ChiQUE01b TaxID=3075376 RepID=UPI002AD573AB|nr:hypothetical protein [Nostoc sp. ChiQUE01b]MDZ8262823.1 hypothetical protein [Nostoc sp. ChiQUE01b]